jgi:hypothetical protein
MTTLTDLTDRQAAIRIAERAKLEAVQSAITSLMAVHDKAASPFSSAFDRAELALYDALASIDGIEDAAHAQAEMIRDMMTPQPLADRYADMKIDDAREAK